MASTDVTEGGSGNVNSGRDDFSNSCVKLLLTSDGGCMASTDVTEGGSGNVNSGRDDFSKFHTSDM